MRIDYHEPKQSYSSSQNKSRPRKESSGGPLMITAVVGVITFAIGFGSGWVLSQKAAKKSFQAATEQKSLENSPPKPQPAPAPQAQPQQPAAATPQQPGAAGQPSAAAPANAPGQPAAEPALTFYKNLPSGQKNTVLGSGINTKENAAKQPLQAPVPANLAKPAAPEPAKPQDKPAARQESAGLTVQVASYSLKSEAESHRAKLAGKGYGAYITESNQGDKGIWYRVRVGRGLAPDAAKELASKLGRSAMTIPDGSQ